MAASGSRQRADNYCSPHGIEVHPETDKPYAACAAIGGWDRFRVATTIDKRTPISHDKVRIVCISDTHSRTDNLEVPDGDILIHAGDFTTKGQLEEMVEFVEFMKKQPHKHKVIIAGNHELSLGLYDHLCGPAQFQRNRGSDAMKHDALWLKKRHMSHPRELLKDFIYLRDSGATVCGLNIWGSPVTPLHRNWAYNIKRGVESLKIWDKIPTDTDIVITHGPPAGIGDQTFFSGNVGCVELYSTITQRVKPKLHVFGHIHEAYGAYSDGTTTFINASTCTENYIPSNPAVCIDLDLPDGSHKLNVTIHPPFETRHSLF